MTDKPTPDEVQNATPEEWLRRWDGRNAIDDLFISRETVAEALREALRQRDEARQRVESVGDKLATAFQERDGAAQQLEAAHRRLGKVEVERDSARQELAGARAALEWYAAGRHIEYSHGHPSGTYLKVEDGVRAREALQQPEGEK